MKVDLDYTANLERDTTFGFGAYNRSAKSNLDFLDFTKTEDYPSIKNITKKYETNSQAIRDKYYSQLDAIKGFGAEDTKKKNDILAQAELELKNEKDRFEKEYNDEVKALRKAGVQIAAQDAQVYLKKGLDTTKTILSSLGIEAPQKETKTIVNVTNKQEEEEEKSGNNVIWWVLGGVAIIGLGIFAYKKFSK